MPDMRMSDKETDHKLVAPTQSMPKLLVDMPAENAARLLTLSVLEQLSMYAMSPVDHSDVTNGKNGTNGTREAAGSADDGRRFGAYRTTLNRLWGCIELYKNALGDSVSTKTRRQLRNLTSAVNDLHDIEETRAWFAATEPSPHVTPTAEWIRDRLGGRRDRLFEEFDELQANPKPFRRLTKRLGVYTKEVRLDDSNDSMSFGELTSRRLLRRANQLRDGVFTVARGDDAETLRGVERAAEDLVYLLEPVRTRTEVERPAQAARAMWANLIRMRSITLVADALVRAGRRIGARQMKARTHDMIWPPSATAETQRPRSPKPVVAELPNDIEIGLTVLAERVRDEAAAAFDEFTNRWPAGEIDVVMVDVSAIATALRDR